MYNPTKKIVLRVIYFVLFSVISLYLIAVVKDILTIENFFESAEAPKLLFFILLFFALLASMILDLIFSLTNGSRIASAITNSSVFVIILGVISFISFTNPDPDEWILSSVVLSNLFSSSFIVIAFHALSYFYHRFDDNPFASRYQNEEKALRKELNQLKVEVEIKNLRKEIEDLKEGLGGEL